MAPTAAQAADMVEGMFQTWLSPQSINGFTVAPRLSIDERVLSNWSRTPDGKLDLARAPLQLEAIVNRFDLRNLDQGNAGEGRFVFGVLDPQGFFPMEFTFILEYKLPASSLAEVQAWAHVWHALGALPFPSEDYNTALANLTERFAKRGAAPNRPNGSAIASIRSNEIALDRPWELREFRFDSDGMLKPSVVELTPDMSFNNTPELAAWINANQDDIIAEKHQLPLTLNGVPFAGGAIINELNGWHAPGVDPEARHHFSLNTCNGCHSSEETNTGFLHIRPRFPGSEASLSGFMTGTTVFDFNTGTERRFNDLGRRNADLTGIVCSAETLAPAKVASLGGATAKTADRTIASKSSLAERLRHGIKRVH